MIAHNPAGGTCPQWYIVQVNLAQTKQERAQLTGTYMVRWWRPHHDDGRWRPLPNCRFWPDIRTLHQDSTFGIGRAIKPQKAEATLRRNPNLGWYQLPINLATDTIAGPFNFAKAPTRAGHKNYHISAEIWNELRQTALQRGIDITELDTIPRAAMRRAQGDQQL